MSRGGKHLKKRKSRIGCFRRREPPDEKDAIPDPGAAARPTEQRGGEDAAVRPRKAKKRSGPLLRFLIKLALIAAIFICVFTFVLGMHINHGDRMYPFIMDGDLVVTYKLEGYRVGDAVAYRNPETGKTEISRIVAIGENRIQITGIGELLINGSVPEEGVFYLTKELEGSGIAFPYDMSQNGYFLLDDHRTVGSDSRKFGELTEEDLLGKAVYVFRRRGI